MYWDSTINKDEVREGLWNWDKNRKTKQNPNRKDQKGKLDSWRGNHQRIVEQHSGNDECWQRHIQQVKIGWEREEHCEETLRREKSNGAWTCRVLFCWGKDQRSCQTFQQKNGCYTNYLIVLVLRLSEAVHEG